MISLNYRDSRPIYEQIQEGLKRLIVTGALGPDEKLPSVRTLATQLSINPNTIQRAYNELETEGYIYSVPGKGSFASGTVETGERRKKELLDKLCALAAELKFLGIGEEELIDCVRRVPVQPEESGNESGNKSERETGRGEKAKEETA